MTFTQDRNQGGAGGRIPLEKFSSPQQKFVGYILKLLDIVQKIWAPLRKLFAPPGVPSWLRACFCPKLVTLLVFALNAEPVDYECNIMIR